MSCQKQQIKFTFNLINEHVTDCASTIVELMLFQYKLAHCDCCWKIKDDNGDDDDHNDGDNVMITTCVCVRNLYDNW